MKRKYYRILSGLLSFTMIFSEIGSMTAMAAPAAEEAEAFDAAEEEGIEEEDADNTGSEDASVDKEDSGESEEADTYDEEEEEAAEEEEEAAEAEEAEEAIEAFEEESAGEEDSEEEASEEAEEIIDTEDPVSEGEGYTLSANVVPKAFKADVEITLSGLVSENRSVEVYVYYTDGEMTTADEGSYSDLSVFKRSNRGLKFQGAGVQQINLSNLTHSTTYQYRLAVLEGTRYVFKTGILEFTTQEGFKITGVEITPKVAEAAVRYTYEWVPADDTSSRKVYMIYTEGADDTVFPENPDPNALPEGIRSYYASYQDFTLNDLAPETAYSARFIGKIGNNATDFHYLTETYSFTTLEQYRTTVSLNASSYSAELTVPLKYDEEKDSQYSDYWIRYGQVYCFYGKASDDVLSGNNVIINKDAEGLRNEKIGQFPSTYQTTNTDISGTIGTGSTPLLPDTEYRYCVAVLNNNKYLRISDIGTFTTKAAVTESRVTASVEVLEYGYIGESVKVSFDNPGNETIRDIYICSENKVSIKAGSKSYDKDGNIVITFSTEGYDELYLAYEVYVGADAEKKVVTVPIEIKRQDQSKRKVTLVSENGITSIAYTVSAYPSYRIDSPRFILKLRKAGEEKFNHSTYSSYSWNESKQSGSFSRLEISGLNDDTEYEYYIQLGSSLTDRAVDVLGSEEAPVSYRTAKTVTYTEEDFTDPVLYKLLKNRYYNMTNAQLELETNLDLSYYSYSGQQGFITSLADIPEKLPNLQSLTIKDQAISDMSPLAGMKKLKSLDLQYNDIKTIPDLSATALEKLDLTGNLVSDTAAASAKIPSSLTDFKYTRRSENIYVSETVYRDTKGGFTFCLETDDLKARKYTVSVNLSGKSEAYTKAAETSTWNRGMVLTCGDFGEILGLSAGQTYKASVLISDGEGTTLEYSFDLKCEEVSTGITVQPYISRDADSLSVQIWTPGSADLKGTVSANLQKNGVVWSGDGSKNISTSNRFSELYKNVIKGHYFSNPGNYEYGRADINIPIRRILEDGDYDVVLTLPDGSKSVLEKAVKVADGPVIFECSTVGNGYDNTGDDIYFSLRGYNLDKDPKLQIEDEKGTIYTEFGELVKTGSSSDRGNYYYIRFKKKSNWSSINEEGKYSLVLKGDPDDVNNTFPMELDSRLLIDGSYVSEGELNVYSKVYNWKTGKFEFRLDKNRAGHGIAVKAKTNTADEWNISGNGIIDGEGVLRLGLTDAAGLYIPRKGTRMMFKITDEVTGDVYEMHNTDFEVVYYNYSESSSDEPDYNFYAWASPYYNLSGNVKISVGARGGADRHSTDALYARIAIGDQTVSKNMTKSGSYDGYDSFETGDWDLVINDPGSYTVKVCEVFDGSEKVLCSCSILVRNVKLLQSYQYVSYDMKDMGKASLGAEFPMYSGDKTDVKKFVKENDIALEVYTWDLKPVSGVKYEFTDMNSNGYLYCSVTGLSASERGYYFRVTAAGSSVTALHGNGTESYYAYDANYSEKERDDRYGKWASRNRYFNFQNDGDRTAYTRVYIGDTYGRSPYTFSFYKYSDSYTLVSQFTVKDSGSHDFSSKEMKDLDPKTIYICRVSDCMGYTETRTGYFAAADSSVQPVDPVATDLYVEFAAGNVFAFTGGKIQPPVRVMYNGKELIETVDYKVSYSNNVKVKNGNKVPTVTVKGITVGGTASSGFSIVARSMDDVTSATAPATNASKVKPEFYLGSYKLTSKDFEVKSKTDSADGQNIEIVVEGKENFKGTRTFLVKKAEPVALKIQSFKPAERVYNGEEQKLKEGELVVTADGKVVSENEAYMVLYPDDVISAGKVNIVIVPLAGYSKSYKKSYTIKACSAAPTVECAKSAVYAPSGAKASVTVKDGETVLKEGKDYKLKYSSNKKAGAKAKVTVSFMGNYKGVKAQKYEFNVTKAPLEGTAVFCPDMAFVKDGKYASAPFVAAGDTLVGAKEYSVKWTAANGKDVTRLKAADIPEEGLAVSVEITAKSNGNYDGVITGSYTITKVDASRAIDKKAKISIVDSKKKKVSKFAYTGSAVTVGGSNRFNLTVGGKYVGTSNYTVHYFNNVNVGKAVYVITGTGSASGFYGSCSGSFRITKGKLRWL
ncbi:MAG: leucine-rich repeat domain-containing protein [Lachnospiraceae bacterium]|nr:leucine-rich repeat domain-containing protein [Lachnospiraceae bacterium]